MLPSTRHLFDNSSMQTSLDRSWCLCFNILTSLTKLSKSIFTPWVYHSILILCHRVILTAFNSIELNHQKTRVSNKLIFQPGSTISIRIISKHQTISSCWCLTTNRNNICHILSQISLPLSMMLELDNHFFCNIVVNLAGLDLLFSSWCNVLHHTF